MRVVAVHEFNSMTSTWSRTVWLSTGLADTGELVPSFCQTASSEAFAKTVDILAEGRGR